MVWVGWSRQDGTLLMRELGPLRGDDDGGCNNECMCARMCPHRTSRQGTGGRCRRRVYNGSQGCHMTLAHARCRTSDPCGCRSIIRMESYESILSHSKLDSTIATTSTSTRPYDNCAPNLDPPLPSPDTHRMRHGPIKSMANTVGSEGVVDSPWDVPRQNTR